MLQAPHWRHVVIKPAFGLSEQQRQTSAYVPARCEHFLFNSWILLVVSCIYVDDAAGLSDRFESYMVGNSQGQIFSGQG